MSTPNDGGPAFPTHENVNDPRSDGFNAIPGMSLRDWFAGQALQGQLANADWVQHMANQHTGNAHGVIVAFAYQYADAMLKAREGK